MQLPSSDAELFQAVQKGDASAFKALYDKHWERIYLKACQRVDKDTAKDMVQEVMATFWRRRAEISINKEGDIGRYLFTAIKYRVISHYAYSKEEIRSAGFFEPLGDQPAWDSLETKELKNFIDAEIGRLPARMQEVFRLSREEDVSIGDIAGKLGISEQTVKNQLSEALRRLRTALEGWNGGGGRSGGSMSGKMLLYVLFCLC